MSKISDIEKRRKLVDKLKIKIKNEVTEKIRNNAKELLLFSDEIDLLAKDNDSNIDFMDFCNEITISKYLLDFVNKDNMFMNWYGKYPELDKIVYVISDKHIEMWLQDDFNFLEEVIYKFGLNIFYITEKDFEFNFTGVIEDILYDKKKEIQSA